ncbi:MAG: hypothetical protein JXX28_17420 [Deltaproteobacteria bacterium]|nr:hypothetical protein [Deltaproteobacteria bacterium]
MFRYDDPGQALEAFADAARLGDEALARQASTAQGWTIGGEAARQVFGRASEEGYRLERDGALYLGGERAVIPVRISHPERVDRQVRVWALLELEDEGWRVAAAIRSEHQAALFLDGRLDAVLDWTRLPPSAEAEAWGRDFAASVSRDAVVSVGELEELLQVPVLGLVPRWAEEGAASFTALDHDDPVCLAFGDAAARLVEGSDPRGVVLASATRGEGALSAAVHLGQVFAGLGQRTLVVDADPDNPALHAIFGSLEPGPGLTDVINERATLDQVVRDGGTPGLEYLPGGNKLPPSGEAFGRIPALFDALREQWDRVILHSAAEGLPFFAGKLGFPPVIVVQAGVAPRAAVQALARKAGVPVLGSLAVRLAPESLPMGPGAEALRAYAEGAPRQTRYLGSYALRGLDRAMAGVEISEDSGPSRELWMLFERGADGKMAALREAHGADLSLLLDGLEAALPAPVAGDTQTVGTFRTQQTVENLTQLSDALGKLVSDALEQGGDPAGAKKLRQLARVSGAALSQVPGVSLETEEASTLALRATVQRVVEGLSPEVAARPLEELLSDEAFLMDNGERLAGALMKALSGTIFPKQAAQRESDKPLQLDLAGLFNHLIDQATRGER